MAFVETVCQPIHELQLRTKLEERQVEITSHADRSEDVRLVQTEIVVVTAGEIEHRSDTGNDIRTVVVEAFRCKYHIRHASDIHRLQVLAHLGGHPGICQVRMVVEREMTGAEIHRRGETQRKM